LASLAGCAGTSKAPSPPAPTTTVSSAEAVPPHPAALWIPSPSAKQVRDVVLEHRAAVRVCWDLAAKETPDLAGRVSVRWVIDPDGTARDAEVVPPSSSAALDACLVRQVLSWRFPTGER